MSEHQGRSRRAVSRPTMALLRLVGWRYSYARDAWVHRIGKGRWGPVFRLRTRLHPDASASAPPADLLAVLEAADAGQHRPTAPAEAPTAPEPAADRPLARPGLSAPQAGTGAPLPRRRPGGSSLPKRATPRRAATDAAPATSAEADPEPEPEPQAAPHSDPTLGTAPCVDGPPPRRVAGGPRPVDPPPIRATG